MQVSLISSQEVNSDLGVVNAARVSLHKKSERYCLHHAYKDSQHPISLRDIIGCQWSISQANQKLIKYLADHNHWTPFAHARLYFTIPWKSSEDELWFYKSINHGGFAYVPIKGYSTDTIKGSLYSWLQNLPSLPTNTVDYVLDAIYKRYPVSLKAFYDHDYPSFVSGYGIIEHSEDYIVQQGWWKLACATLLVKVPIFLARQIRTSQVGFAYGDMLVEGEAFVYNEVSRRYVNEEPEFYNIQQWRVREGGGVKQGSTDLAEPETNQRLTFYQRSLIEQAQQAYKFKNAHSAVGIQHIAPEQLRALLPQSMYTEFWMTGTLHRWAQFLALRLKPDVQEETREVAGMVKACLATAFPTWAQAYQLH